MERSTLDLFAHGGFTLVRLGENARERANPFAAAWARPAIRINARGASVGMTQRRADAMRAGGIGHSGGTIAVTGATGHLGRRVAEDLLAQGVRPRVVVRDPQRVENADRLDVRVAPAYGAFDAMRDALTGSDSLLLIPAAESPDRMEQQRTAVRAAVAAGVRRIVYVSIVNAARDATFTLARDHWDTEEAIRAAVTSWTFLRMNFYLDFIASMVQADGVLRGPAGNGRFAAVLRDDVADASAAVLTGDGHDAQTYDLTGPVAFTFAEAADIMTRITGRSVRFHDETDGEAFASRAGSGADWEIRGWVTSYQAIRNGDFAAVSQAVERLMGRPPTSLESFLQSVQ